MQWDVIVKRIEGQQAAVLFEGEEEVSIPVKYLPSGCRVGDVLKVEVSFKPFETLERLFNEPQGI